MRRLTQQSINQGLLFWLLKGFSKGDVDTDVDVDVDADRYFGCLK